VRARVWNSAWKKLSPQREQDKSKDSLASIDSDDATVKSYTFPLIHIIAIISFVDVASFLHAIQDTVLSQPALLSPPPTP
jgi:hypothetical protein